MAVWEANGDGGLDGRPVELVVRCVEGPWGSGTKDIVDLVFDEQILALIGGLDGRSAHLIEQVAAKGLVPFVSPWASDPTLTQAFVPWFFRMVPDDRQQAKALADEIFGSRGLRRVATVSGESYDARIAETTFVGIAEGLGHSITVRLSANGMAAARPPLDYEPLLDRIAEAQIDGIALFVSRTESLELTRRLRNRGMHQQVFATLFFIDEVMVCDMVDDGNKLIGIISEMGAFGKTPHIIEKLSKVDGVLRIKQASIINMREM